MIIVKCYSSTSASMQIASESHIKVVLMPENKVISISSSKIGLLMLVFERKIINNDSFKGI